MRWPALLALAAGVAGAPALADPLADLDRRLVWTRGPVRIDLAGTIDAEGWLLDGRPPGTVAGGRDDFGNARLTLLLDARLGPRVYGFVQARVDRGFDARADADVDARADEYLLRWNPFGGPRLHVQAGKFATVIGGWVPRHLSWENPFVTAPLPYDHMTVVGDAGAAPSVAGLVARRDQSDRKALWVPIVWGPSYTSGAAAFGRLGAVDYAVEVKNAAPSSRPETWDATDRGWSEPSVGGRLGLHPAPWWRLGVSGAGGPYLRRRAAATLAGRERDDHQQLLLGADASMSHRRLELWAEVLASRFEVPIASRAPRARSSVDVDTIAYYVEGRYQVAPGLFGAARLGQQLFGSVTGGHGRRRPVDHDAWRADAAVIVRPTTHVQVKLQYGYLDQTGRQRQGPQLGIVQLTLRF